MRDPAEQVAPVAPVAPTPRRGQHTVQDLWQTVRLIVWGIVFIVLVAFIVQNLDHVRLQVLSWERSVRLAWVLLVAGALGYILGWLRPRFRRR
ncbi:MAG: LapA family protein [Chloroflexota bacterium]|nr:LapA family protein [Chloroflexota bacterium]